MLLRGDRLRPRVISPPLPRRRGACVPPRKCCPRWKKGTEGCSRLTNQYLSLLGAEKHTHTHTNITPRKGAARGAAGRGRRCARRERPARGRLRSRLARGGTGSRRRPGRSAPSEHPAPSRDGLLRGPVPFCFTFLGSHHEPPGMIRNTWPLGAAGAQEIRTLKLEEERGSRLGKSNVPGAGGCLPWFLGPSTDFLPVAGTPCSRVSGGSLEGERGGRGRGRGRGTGTKTSSWK